VSAFIDEHRGRFGVEPICRVLDVSASAYYQRATGQRSARAVEDERLLGRISELHAANYFAYGSRRMWKALRRAGEQPGRGRVERLMRSHGICGAKRRGKPWKTTTPDLAARRRPDLVDRDFSAAGPNELWVADLTYLRCWEGVVFFAFILDAYSRRVVGWQFAAHMRTTLVLDALRMALHQRGPGADVALVHHSDRGSQGELCWSSQRGTYGPVTRRTTDPDDGRRSQRVCHAFVLRGFAEAYFRRRRPLLGASALVSAPLASSSGMRSAIEFTIRDGRYVKRSTSSGEVTPVSTRIVSSPASSPETMSVFMLSPIIAVLSECPSMVLSAVRIISGFGLPT
jgi:transposase InsO family protein